MGHIERYLDRMELNNFGLKRENQIESNHPMSKIAQTLSIVVALIFVALAALNLFSPVTAAAVRGLEPDGALGLTNIRLLAAPLLMIAVAAVAAAIKQNPVFLGPAVLYLMFSVVITVVGMFVDGGGADVLRGLGITVALLIFAEIPVQMFNRIKKAAA
ncbi:MAG: hypothetical protein ACJAVT_002704 [Yoonia sp.]|jgi:hypothetical protein